MLSVVIKKFLVPVPTSDGRRGCQRESIRLSKGQTTGDTDVDDSVSVPIKVLLKRNDVAAGKNITTAYRKKANRSCETAFA